jgi:RNA recognition motif. (a.k.a. RRM, RBD, or RNP domain)
MSSSEASSSSRGSSPVSQKGKDLKRKRPQDVTKVSDDSDSDSDGSSSDSEGETGMQIDEEDEVPVLSHKEIRKQKKREKKAAEKAAAASDEDSDVPKKKRKLKDGAATPEDSPASQKRQNSVWVGNMSFKTTPENLRTFFKDVGEITRIHMPMKPASRPNLPKENRGSVSFRSYTLMCSIRMPIYCFLLFAHSDSPMSTLQPQKLKFPLSLCQRTHWLAESY